MAGIVSNALPTVYQTGPNDKLAVVDVYTNAPTTPQNVQPSQSSIVDEFRSLALNGAGLLNQINNGLTSVVRDATSAANFITDTFSGTDTAVNSAPQELVNQLAASMGAPTFARSVANLAGNIRSSKVALDKAFTNVRTAIGGIDTDVSFDVPDIAGAFGITAIINAIAGEDHQIVMTDITHQRQVLIGFISSTIQQGCPENIPSIIASGHPADQYALTLSVLNAAATYGDFPTFHQYWSQIRSIGDVLAAYPNIAILLLSNYKFPSNFKFPVRSVSDEFRAVLDALNPTWAFNQSIGYVTLLSYCNNASAQLLYLQPDVAPLVAVAALNLPLTISKAVSLSMPWVALPGSIPSTATGIQKPATVNPAIKANVPMPAITPATSIYQ